MSSILLQRKKVGKFRSLLIILFTSGLLFYYFQTYQGNSVNSPFQSFATVILIGGFVIAHIFSLGNRFRKKRSGDFEIYTRIGFFKFSRFTFSKEDVSTVALEKDPKNHFVVSIRLQDGRFILIDSGPQQEIMKAVQQEVTALLKTE